MDERDSNRSRAAFPVFKMIVFLRNIYMRNIGPVWIEVVGESHDDKDDIP